MSLSILNNIPTLEAQNQLAMTNANLQNTLFQLSSGSKINSGADDPAGMSIANGLQANISALTQSAQNVSDGVGLLQTADGALSQVTTLLNRAVTLATEAGNSGLTTAQQTALNNEFTSITNEVNQIGQNTTYNNTAVFTGTPLSVFLSDGSATDASSASGPTISVNMPTLTANSIGLGTFATGTFSLSANPFDGDQVTIGATAYTFKTTLTGAANEVLIGGGSGSTGISETLQNLQAAVGGGAGKGVTYGAGTVANASAQITGVLGGSATLQSLTAGVGGAAQVGPPVVAAEGNSIAATYTIGATGAAGAEGVNAYGAWTNPTGVAGTLTGGSGAAVDLSTASDAQSALVAIEGAISSVAASRGAIGSGINQMNAAVQVMNNTSQNLTSSLSGIQDANVGQVVANMSKYQVLEQTGIAALSQANQQEQTVLKLLQ
jgi:flagellin